MGEPLIADPVPKLPADLLTPVETANLRSTQVDSAAVNVAPTEPLLWRVVVAIRVRLQPKMKVIPPRRPRGNNRSDFCSDVRARLGEQAEIMIAARRSVRILPSHILISTSCIPRCTGGGVTGTTVPPGATQRAMRACVGAHRAAVSGSRHSAAAVAGRYREYGTTTMGVGRSRLRLGRELGDWIGGVSGAGHPRGQGSGRSVAGTAPAQAAAAAGCAAAARQHHTDDEETTVPAIRANLAGLDWRGAAPSPGC